MGNIHHYLYNEAARVARNLKAIEFGSNHGYVLFFAREANEDIETERQIDFVIKEIAAIADYAIFYEVQKSVDLYTLSISWDTEPDGSRKSKTTKFTNYPVVEVVKGTNASTSFRYSN